MADSHCTVYVGSYTTAYAPGIQAFIFDTVTGHLTANGSFGAIPNPSFIIVHPNGRWLYAVSELSQSVEGKAGEVWAMALHKSTGTNTFSWLNFRSGGGDWPCHLAFDGSGNWLVVSNYASGTVAVFPIQHDGSLGTMADLVQHDGSGANPERQAGPHTHSALFTPDNRFLIVADLGIDQLIIYAFDAASGKLKAHSQVRTRPGAGPRHMAFHSQSQQLAVSCELDNTVAIYDYDVENGHLGPRQVLETLPPDAPENSVADLHFSSNGERLFVSNRGHNSVATFAVATDGHLTRLAIDSSGGDWPRHFAIAPDGRFLLVANQYSGEIVVLPVLDGVRIFGDPVARVAVPGASCVQFGMA